MALTYRGSLTPAEASPITLSAVTMLQSSLAAPVANLQAQLAAALAVSVSPPQLITDVIQNLLGVIAALQALLASGMVITPPTIAASLALIGQLTAELGLMQAGLSFAADMAGTLAVPGIHAYTFVGKTGEFGPALSSALSNGLPGGAGPNEFATAAVFAASSGVAIDAMNVVFGIG